MTIKNCIATLMLAVIALVSPNNAGSHALAEPQHTFVGDTQQPRSLAERYCANVGDKAADIRYAQQMKQLTTLSDSVAERTAALEVKLAELKEWVRKRDEFVRQGTEVLVNIFAAMRPDAASQQLTAVDERTAAAILMKVKPRKASSILNEMDPRRAARLAATIAGAVRVADGRKR